MWPSSSSSNVQNFIHIENAGTVIHGGNVTIHMGGSRSLNSAELRRLADGHMNVINANAGRQPSGISADYLQRAIVVHERATSAGQLSHADRKRYVDELRSLKFALKDYKQWMAAADASPQGAAASAAAQASGRKPDMLATVLPGNLVDLKRAIDDLVREGLPEAEARQDAKLGKRLQALLQEASCTTTADADGFDVLFKSFTQTSALLAQGAFKRRRVTAVQPADETSPQRVDLKFSMECSDA